MPAQPERGCRVPAQGDSRIAPKVAVAIGGTPVVRQAGDKPQRYSFPLFSGLRPRVGVRGVLSPV